MNMTVGQRSTWTLPFLHQSVRAEADGAAHGSIRHSRAADAGQLGKDPRGLCLSRAASSAPCLEPSNCSVAWNGHRTRQPLRSPRNSYHDWSPVGRETSALAPPTGPSALTLPLLALSSSRFFASAASVFFFASSRALCAVSLFFTAPFFSGFPSGPSTTISERIFLTRSSEHYRSTQHPNIIFSTGTRCMHMCVRGGAYAAREARAMPSDSTCQVGFCSFTALCTFETPISGFCECSG